MFVNNKQEAQDLQCPFNLKHIPYLTFVKECEEPIIGESCIISNSISVFFWGNAGPLIWDVFLNIETLIVSLRIRWNITRITFFEEMITPFAQKRISKSFAYSFAYSDYGGESHHMLATLHQHCSEWCSLRFFVKGGLQ